MIKFGLPILLWLLSYQQNDLLLIMYNLQNLILPISKLKHNNILSKFRT